ncbi:phenylacetate--CoA ligase family protein [bacterium]|nr:MAG: phenylacetate--CoA ligase family protein [bacterium]
MSVPPALLERVPTADAAAAARWKRLVEHPDAPKFNYAAGDRLTEDDLRGLDALRRDLRSERGPRRRSAPGGDVLARVTALAPRVPSFRARLFKGLDPARHWDEVPASSRADLAEAPALFVPDDEPLDRLVVYRTAGTTGHPVSVPHHPLAVASYLPLLEFALERHGLREDFRALPAACCLVGHQTHTYTYATVLSGWSHAGFVKANLRESQWTSPDARRRYFADLAPRLLTGDPASVSELVRLGLPVRPAAVVTTSTALAPAVRERVSKALGCPVIDWYSLVETGPIAYACPRGQGFHQLPHDLHVETVDALGRPTPAGVRGEVTVTGGRNPLAPLLRYRTGDWARLETGACPCGDPMPRLMELEGREPVLFRAADGTPVTAVDLSRLLREFPLLMHRFAQKRDLSCALDYRAASAVDRGALETALRTQLGEVPLTLREDRALGEDGTKVPAYLSELELS